MTSKPFKYREIDRKTIVSLQSMGGVLNFFSDRIVLSGTFGSVETVSAVYKLKTKTHLKKPFRPKGGDKTFLDRLEGNPIVFDKTADKKLEYIFEDDLDSLYESDVLPALKIIEPQQKKQIFSQTTQYDPHLAASIINGSPFKSYFKAKHLVSSIMKLARIKWDLPAIFIIPYDGAPSIYLSQGESTAYSDWIRIESSNEKLLMDNDDVYYCKTFNPMKLIQAGQYEAKLFADNNDDVFLTLSNKQLRIRYYIPMQKHPFLKKEDILKQIYPNFALARFAKQSRQNTQMHH